MYVVEHTGRPYGPCEAIPESAWSRFSSHRTQSTASRQIRAQKNQPHLQGSLAAWDDHYRIVHTTRWGEFILR